MRHSYPNKADSAPARVAYTIAAEFINRLDAFLEWQEADGWANGGTPSEAALTVHQCVQAALEMLYWFERTWYAPPELRKPFSGCDLATSTPTAAELTTLATQVVQEELSQAALGGADPWDDKARLMHLLACELFARLEALVDGVLARTKAWVAPNDMELMRAYLDAAMGMVYELCEVSWAAGAPVPVDELIPAMQGHVRSCRLEEGGPQAVAAIADAYEVCVAEALEMAV